MSICCVIDCFARGIFVSMICATAGCKKRRSLIYILTSHMLFLNQWSLQIFAYLQYRNDIWWPLNCMYLKREKHKINSQIRLFCLICIWTSHNTPLHPLAHAKYAKPTMYNSFWLLALCHRYHSVSPLYHSSHIVLLRHMSLYPHQSMAEQWDTWDSNLIQKKQHLFIHCKRGYFMAFFKTRNTTIWNLNFIYPFNCGGMIDSIKDIIICNSKMYW